MSPLTRLILGTICLVTLYFLVPIESASTFGLRTVVSIALLVFITWLIVRQLLHQVRHAGSPLWTLALAMVAGLLAFAMIDYMIEFNSPGQFVALKTRLDALYFALTTAATVGYGDVHATGQLARGVVCLQMAFNFVILTTAASVIVGQLRSRAVARSTGQ